ncbi:MAG TPA: tripartite tricarboxylate transporter substrate binding protein [Xanthobacteraceae bacterium]
MPFKPPLLRAALMAAVLTGAASPAPAQTYPNRPVHLVVAYSPGGTGDYVARLLSDKLAAALGQSVVVENRAGASGAIGAQSVVAAPPDGHMLLLGQTAEVAINQHWVKGLSYDPERDLQPVALAAVVPLALLVPGQAPHATLPEMLKAAGTSGRGLSFASAGHGTPGHFAGEFLKAKTKANLTHVPYKGAGPALNDLLGGHVDLYFPGLPAAMPHIKSGTLKALAVSSAKRSAVAPDLPTVAEAARIDGFDFTLWAALFAPRATPPEVVARLNREINAILAQPETRAKLLEAGAEVTPLSIEQTTAFVRAESDKYRQIIQETGVKPE